MVIKYINLVLFCSVPADSEAITAIYVYTYEVFVVTFNWIPHLISQLKAMMIKYIKYVIIINT